MPSPISRVRVKTLEHYKPNSSKRSALQPSPAPVLANLEKDTYDFPMPTLSTIWSGRLNESTATSKSGLILTLSVEVARRSEALAPEKP